MPPLQIATFWELRIAPSILSLQCIKNNNIDRCLEKIPASGEAKHYSEATTAIFAFSIWCRHLKANGALCLGFCTLYSTLANQILPLSEIYTYTYAGLLIEIGVRWIQWLDWCFLGGFFCLLKGTMESSAQRINIFKQKSIGLHKLIIVAREQTWYLLCPICNLCIINKNPLLTSKSDGLLLAWCTTRMK